MELKQNPFSFYDFLGYFTPGSLFVYFCIAVSIHSGDALFSITELEASAGLTKADLYIPFILVAYTIGHVLSYVSSVTVERYAIWALGYPSKYLLGIKPDGYFSMKENKITRTVVRSLVFLILLPITVPEIIIGRAFGLRTLYAKKLDDLLVNLIVGKLDPLLKEKGGLSNLSDYGDAKSSNFFLFAYHYCVENSQRHFPKMQNYVALYGFLRTLTLLSVIAFWTLAWQLSVHPFSLLQNLLLILVVSLSSYIFFIGFVKFYTRFCLEVLMALAVTDMKSNKAKQSGTS